MNYDNEYVSNTHPAVLQIQRVHYERLRELEPILDPTKKMVQNGENGRFP